MSQVSGGPLPVTNRANTPPHTSHLTVLVTGVPGWLGSRVVDVLLRGYSGEGPAESTRRIRVLTWTAAEVSGSQQRWGSRVEWCTADLRRADSLAEAVRGVEVIFHVAGVIHPNRIADLAAVNTQGTQHLLDAAVQAGVKRVVYVSSNSVGGYTRGGRLMQEADPPHPYMAYGRSKYLAERALQAYAQQRKLEAIILRPCWYYGPGQPERQTRFFRMIKQGRPIIFGNGQNLRSLSYLDNVIQAMLLAEQAPVANGQVYWIADERPYPTIEIYRTIAALLGVTSFAPRHIPGFVSELCMGADGCLQRLGGYQQEIHVAGEMNKDIACSIEKAKAELGYRPRVGLEEGMRRSIAWCRSVGQEL